MIVQIIGWFCLVMAFIMGVVSCHKETARENTDGDFMTACAGFLIAAAICFK